MHPHKGKGMWRYGNRANELGRRRTGSVRKDVTADSKNIAENTGVVIVVLSGVLSHSSFVKYSPLADHGVVCVC